MVHGAMFLSGGGIRPFMDSDVFKALSDGNRLTIMTMLADGEICACRILEALDITQPTLSHHMKILQRSGLVNVRKVGQWSHYSINRDRVSEVVEFMEGLLSPSGSGPIVPE